MTGEERAANTQHLGGKSTWLYYYRSAAGMTQRQLAEVSGVNVRQIQRVENGESDIGNVTAKNLFALANALDVDPRALLTGGSVLPVDREDGQKMLDTQATRII